MSKVLSVEIGYSLIKIVETDYKVKAPKVYNCINLDTPAGVLYDGELTVTEELTNLIRNALAANRIKTKQVVFTITSTKIASREVLLPNVKENRLGALIRANAGDYFPVNISQYEIAYSSLGTVGDNKDNIQRKVLVLAAPRNILEGYEQLAKACGLSLQALDYSCNSIYQIVKNECRDGTQMVIKVDEQVTVITILDNGQIALQRSVPYGVDDAIHTLIDSGAYGTMDYQQALELLRRKTCVNRTLNAQTDIAEQDGPSAELMEESVQMQMAKQKITESLEMLMRGIARVIDFYNSRNHGNQIQKTYLTGLGGDFSGLSKLLTNELGFHIVVLKKVEGFNLERTFREASFGEYLACLGAVIAPLGFMRDKEEGKTAKKGFELTLLMSASLFILCLVISVALLTFAYLPYKEAKNKNLQYRANIEELSTCIPYYLEYLGTTEACEYLSTAYGMTQLETAHVVDFIEEMEEKMPHAFFVDSFTANAAGFSMNVTVNTKAEAADCIEQLRTFENVAGLTVNGIYDNRTTNGTYDTEGAENVNILDAENGTVTFSVQGSFYGYVFSGTESQIGSTGLSTTEQTAAEQAGSSDDELEQDLDSLK